MKHNELLVKSYSKINICLNVKCKRDDGFHEIDTIMLPLELHDSIFYNVIKTNGDSFVTIDEFVVGGSRYNSITNAISSLEKMFNFPERFRVTVHKNIPMKSGLGGGSSDAASTLLAINELKNLKLTNDELIKLATPLGADVPFFINSIPSRCQGIGEKITPINVKNDYFVIVIKPEYGCQTKDIYEVADTMELETYDIDAVIKALEEGDDISLAKNIGNALEKPCFSLHPELQGIKDELKSYGVDIVLMSGSGSSIFGMSTNKKLIKSIAKKFDERFYVEITKVLKKHE